MKMRVGAVLAMCFVVALGLAVATNGFAQGKAQKGAKSAEKTSNIQGKVGKIDKDTITVLVGNSPKPVTINSDTKFLMGHSNDNKPGSLGDVKQGYFIACSGSKDAKQQFVAKECVYRDKQ